MIRTLLAAAAALVLAVLRGEEPVYLRRLEATGARPLEEGAAELKAALDGSLAHAALRPRPLATAQPGHRCIDVSLARERIEGSSISYIMTPTA